MLYKLLVLSIRKRFLIGYKIPPPSFHIIPEGYELLNFWKAEKSTFFQPYEDSRGKYKQ